MIHLSVKELLAIQRLKLHGEKTLALETQEPYPFTPDDISALSKIFEGLESSKVKIRYRKPGRDKRVPK